MRLQGVRLRFRAADTARVCWWVARLTPMAEYQHRSGTSQRDQATHEKVRKVSNREQEKAKPCTQKCVVGCYRPQHQLHPSLRTTQLMRALTHTQLPPPPMYTVQSTHDANQQRPVAASISTAPLPRERRPGCVWDRWAASRGRSAAASPSSPQPRGA